MNEITIVTNSYNNKTYRFTNEECRAYFARIEAAGYVMEDCLNGDEWGVSHYFAKGEKQVIVTTNDEASYLEFINPNPTFDKVAA